MPNRAPPVISALGRRALIAGLAGMPALARAQAPGLTPTLPQVVTPLPTPVLPGLAAPTPPARPPLSTAAVDKSKIYYVFFDQAIDVNSMRALRRQLANLVEAGVTEIHLVINSTGGLISQTLVTYSFIRSLPATVDTHAQGLVASAANVLFLAGQTRTADHTARFLFHPSVGQLAGAVNEQQLQDQVSLFDAVNGMLNQIYQERTHLTADDTRSFGQHEVIYTAEEAQRLGIVQTVADLAIPGDGKARILFLE